MSTVELDHIRKVYENKVAVEGLSLRIEPGDAKTNYLLAEVRFERHDLDGAHAAVSEALRLRPDEPAYRKLSNDLDASRMSANP